MTGANSRTLTARTSQCLRGPGKHIKTYPLLAISNVARLVVREITSAGRKQSRSLFVVCLDRRQRLAGLTSARTICCGEAAGDSGAVLLMRRG